jgi:cell shape-determining protein MreD
VNALILAYAVGSLFVLRVIWLEIALAESMSWYERAWRAAVSFALWPFLLGVALGNATRNFFWKGHWQ